MTTQRLKFNSF